MISDRVGSKTSIDEHLANHNDVLEVLDSSSGLLCEAMRTRRRKYLGYESH